MDMYLTELGKRRTHPEGKLGKNFVPDTATPVLCKHDESGGKYKKSFICNSIRMSLGLRRLVGLVRAFS